MVMMMMMLMEWMLKVYWLCSIGCHSVKQITVNFYHKYSLTKVQLIGLFCYFGIEITNKHYCTVHC
jgi:hypothetical protein